MPSATVFEEFEPEGMKVPMNPPLKKWETHAHGTASILKSKQYDIFDLERVAVEREKNQAQL